MAGGECTGKRGCAYRPEEKSSTSVYFCCRSKCFESEDIKSSVVKRQYTVSLRSHLSSDASLLDKH